MQRRLEVARGQLCVIVGPIGAGKSRLIHEPAAEMHGLTANNNSGRVHLPRWHHSQGASCPGLRRECRLIGKNSRRVAGMLASSTRGGSVPCVLVSTFVACPKAGNLQHRRKFTE